MCWDAVLATHLCGRLRVARWPLSTRLPPLPPPPPPPLPPLPPLSAACSQHGAARHRSRAFAVLAAAAVTQDDSGKILLHYAAEKQATDAVVQSLLTAYADGTKVKAVGGNLPLHYAAACSASDAVAEMITKIYPDATKGKDLAGNLPLHLACQHRASPGVVTTLLGAYDDAAQVFAGGSLPLHFASFNESSDDVIKVLLTAYPAACRVKDEQGNLPLALAYKKQELLGKYAAEMLQVRKAAELNRAKWHLEGIDATKFKLQIKEVDDYADERIAIHEKANEAVAANRQVMATLLAATFEVFTPSPEQIEPTMVPAHVLPQFKEKVEEDAWLAALDEGKSADKKKGNPLAKAVDKLGQLPLHRALVKKASLAVVQVPTRGSNLTSPGPTSKLIQPHQPWPRS
jgi:hypothetical protein